MRQHALACKAQRGSQEPTLALQVFSGSVGPSGWPAGLHLKTNLPASTRSPAGEARGGSPTGFIIHQYGPGESAQGATRGRPGHGYAPGVDNGGLGVSQDQLTPSHAGTRKPAPGNRRPGAESTMAQGSAVGVSQDQLMPPFAGTQAGSWEPPAGAPFASVHRPRPSQGPCKETLAKGCSPGRSRIAGLLSRGQVPPNALESSPQARNTIRQPTRPGAHKYKVAHGFPGSGALTHKWGPENRQAPPHPSPSRRPR